MVYCNGIIMMMAYLRIAYTTIQFNSGVSQ